MKDLLDNVPGSLTQIELDDKTRDTLLDYLDLSTPNGLATLLWAMLGSRDWLMFYDVCEGATIKIPSRQNMAKIVSNIKIYNYIVARDATDEAFEKASVIFKKRRTQIEAIYEKVKTAFETKQVNEEDEEDDYTCREDSEQD